MSKTTIRNLTWKSDPLGDYWTADLIRGGVKVGVTGSYYELNDKGQRASKEEQELELSEQFEIES